MQIVGCKVAGHGVCLSHLLVVRIATILQPLEAVTLTTPYIVSRQRIPFQTLGILLASTMAALAFGFSAQKWIDRRVDRCSAASKGRRIPPQG
jgi:hypothetical protein